jgi:hypothetical protein
MFKFVEDNVNGVGTKRKLSAGPCDTCKRRHVRDTGLLCLYPATDDGHRNAARTMTQVELHLHRNLRKKDRFQASLRL